MITQSKQRFAKLVDISALTKEHNNPIIGAFKTKGQVFGFAAPFIVADELKLTQTNINGQDLLVDSDGKTYKVVSTTDVAPSFTKGYARSKDGVNIKRELVLLCDNLCILERPVDGKSTMTVFKTTDLILDNSGRVI